MTTSPGMVVDGDVLREVIADAVPRYLTDLVAHQIADAALGGAVRAGMTVLQGPNLTPRAPAERIDESSVNTGEMT